MTRKNILITGASSGLGEEMARQFAALGRNLALAARRTDRLETLRTELLKANPGIKVVIRALDVNDHDAVFKVFGEFKSELGTIDRVIVNAGLGKGQPLGTGFFEANKQTAVTNFVSALAQCEASMEIFREQNAGHLVVISSMSAMRGLGGNLSTYAATKAGVAALAEGIRADLLKSPINVSTIYPGYIRSEMNEKVKKTPLMVDTVPGVRSMVKAIEKESAEACTPAWPWTLMGFAMRNLPLSLVAKLS
ncbi:SDR family oxidoreductase [Actinokineospora xionganensis]|uniref:SDR family oxidoreductase n=1 Tax=Actinokineospora xionganensis TaxID=2684470 RepID=A0ABR7L5I5_9PSEU|nr:SDR family oxidoreductase [Actinokineospora xionganensis]MBC6447946.1 SDR family oxidoreductase [Actinokineospora xionganensis]